MFTVVAIAWLLIQGIRGVRATERIAQDFGKLPLDAANQRLQIMILREAAQIRAYLSTAVVLLAVIADRLVLFR
jgi:hypothetical protein